MAPVSTASKAFLSALLLLCISVAATYACFTYFQASERAVTHTWEVRSAVGDLESAVNYAARARMSYLMSGDAPDLNEYKGLVSRIPAELRRLCDLTRDNPVQVDNCERLGALTTDRIRAWDETISQKLQGQVLDLNSLLQLNLRLSAQYSLATAGITAEENRLLAIRKRKAQHGFGLAVTAVVASFTIAIFLLYLHYRLLANELAAREAAERQARSSFERESAMLREQERYRSFVESVKDYAIYVLDAEGRVASWNKGAERIKGYSASEIVGQSFSRFFTEEDLREGKPEEELRIAAQQGHFEGEAWRVRKDGTRFWASNVLTAIKGEQGKLEGFAKVTRDVTERKHAEESLRRANTELAAEVAERATVEKLLAASEQALRGLSLHLLRTQDEERKRIGRELHDSLGQYLAMLKMNLDLLQMGLPAGSDPRGQLAECIRLAEESMREVRTISYLLYPPMLEEVGLKSAVPWFLEGFAVRSGVQATLEIDPEFRRLERDVELALFRVLQEGLTNVHRHSGSPTARVRLFVENGYAVLEIQDRGRGIPRHLLASSSQEWQGSIGVGIRGMNERMQQLGGRLEVASSESGTTVTARVPGAQPVSALSA